jgi:hypothetical protein
MGTLATAWHLHEADRQIMRPSADDGKQSSVRAIPDEWHVHAARGDRDSG